MDALRLPWRHNHRLSVAPEKTVCWDSQSGGIPAKTFDKMFEDAIDLYDKKLYPASRKLFEQIIEEGREAREGVSHEDCLFNIAACFAQEGNFSQSLDLYSKIEDGQTSLLYNRALCNYYMGNYPLTLKDLDKLIGDCCRKSPKLIQNHESGLKIDLNLVNELQENFVIEAINLKAASLFKIKSPLESAKCLEDIFPPDMRLLDCVTLHNKAIYQYSDDDDDSIDSTVLIMNHLLSLYDSSGALRSHVPRQTFRNTMILACGSLEQAQEMRRRYDVELIQSFTEKELKFLDAYLERSDELSVKLLDGMVEAELNGTLTMDRHLLTVIATHLSLILKRNKRYTELERLLLKITSDKFSDPIGWKKNLAHSIYMQESRYEDCAKLYGELLVELNSNPLSQIDPFILGGLCVSHVLIGQNSEAETLMKRIEEEEQNFESSNPWTDELGGFRRKCSQISMVNMIIGTLYCTKGNYEFGLGRIIKSIDPVESRLNPASWAYFKRALIGLLDSHCKQMIYARDDLFLQILTFLVDCETFCAQKLNESKPTIIAKFKGETINLIDWRPEKGEQELDTLFYLRVLQTTHKEARFLRSLVSKIFYD